jgi:hypothetical protein
MKEIIVDGGNHRYLSELDLFKEDIPVGVINKTIPDVGGTYVAANCDSNYIIVCPYTDLIDSIAADKNNKYEIFKIYEGTTEAEFEDYMNRTTVHKIAITYDSFSYKLVNWITDYNNWKVLVDEYHLILEDMDFRFDAIDNLLQNINKFNHHSYLSATPIKLEYEIPQIKELPHYRVVWNNMRKIEVLRVKCPKIAAGSALFIDDFLNHKCSINGKEVEELYIFCNSVRMIKQFLTTLKVDPEDVKICCADRIRNKKILDEYNIESITTPNKRLNFFTKKGYQGCNLFTNNGLIVVISDSGKANTLVDVSTTLEQIAGRLRENNQFHNIFNNVIVHLYSSKNYCMSDKKFNEILETKNKEAKIMIDSFNNLNIEAKQVWKNKLNLDSELVSIINNEMVFNELKKYSFIRKQEIRKQYMNDTFMLAGYRDGSGRFTSHESIDLEGWEDFESRLVKLTTVSYQSLLKEYLSTTDSDLKEDYEKEYPEFILFKKYLKESEMNSLRWNKEKMLKRVSDLKLMDKIFKEVHEVGFISSKDLKEKLAKIFNKYGISCTAKASLIEEQSLYPVKQTVKKIDGKAVRGYEIGNYRLNFSL